MTEKQFIYLIRHGETIWNKACLLQGRKDILLTEKGVNQASEMAAFFKDKSIDLIGTSPLMRTQHTATVITKELNVPIQTFQDLIARQYGDWEGKTIEQIRDENREHFISLYGSSVKDLYINAPHPTVESYQQVAERVMRAISKIYEKKMSYL